MNLNALSQILRLLALIYIKMDSGKKDTQTLYGAHCVRRPNMVNEFDDRIIDFLLPHFAFQQIDDLMLTGPFESIDRASFRLKVHLISFHLNQWHL